MDEETRRILYQSNAWYNEGLKRAKARDMNGAIQALRRSLQYNKSNIAARNLLGLVYYGIGEIAEALVEWIISKNFQSTNNIADTYIRKTQEAARELDTLNEAIKKYNQCLASFQEGGEDVAIIQLKEVIRMHPTFLKAYQFLALLYLQTEQYSEARPILKTARSLDKTNPITQQYTKELNDARDAKRRKKRRTRTRRAGRSHENGFVMNQLRRFSQFLSGRIKAVNLVAGLLIGAAVVWFLIVPAIDEARSDAANKEILAYSQRIDALESQVSAQTKTLNEYRSTNEDSEASLAANASSSESYENLVEALSQYLSYEYSYETIADTLLKVNRDSLGTHGQEEYDSLAENVFANACSTRYGTGIQAYNVANYDTAIENLAKVIQMDEGYDSGGALYYLGLAYRESGDTEAAAKYLQQVGVLFPDGGYAAQASEALSEMASAAQDTEEE